MNVRDVREHTDEASLAIHISLTLCYCKMHMRLGTYTLRMSGSESARRASLMIAYCDVVGIFVGYDVMMCCRVFAPHNSWSILLPHETI